jgi:hypothetical protein
VGEVANASETRLRVVVLVAASSLVLTALLWVRTQRLLPPDPRFALPADHHIYLFMAQHPLGDFHVAPWCWRILVPLTARMLPFSTTLGFELAAFVSLWAAGFATFFICRRLGFRSEVAVLGVVSFYGLSFAAKWNVFDFWLTDPAAFAFLAAAVAFLLSGRDVGFAVCLTLGVLAKESVIFALPLFYMFRKERTFDRDAALRMLLVGSPAIAVLVAVRVGIPAWNSNIGYTQALPKPIAANARTVADYSLVALARHVVAERFASLGSTLLRTVSAFGLLVGVLPFLGGRRALRMVAKFTPFLVLVYAQLLFAFNTERLLVLAFPAIIPLALCGIDHLRSRGVPFVALAAAVFTSYGFNLVSTTRIAPNVLWQAAAIVICLAPTLRRRNPEAAHTG